MSPQDVCKTVKIRVPAAPGNPDGITEINATDYDPSKHTFADDPQNKLPLPLPTLKGWSDNRAKDDIGAPMPVDATEIVRQCFEQQQMSIAEWNNLANGLRDGLLNAFVANAKAANIKNGGWTGP